MAPESTRSDRVRQYLDSHPNATPKEVADALAKYGVRPGLVSNIKFRMRAAARRGDDPLALAFRLVAETDSIKEAHECVDRAARIWAILC